MYQHVFTIALLSAVLISNDCGSTASTISHGDRLSKLQDDEREAKQAGFNQPLADKIRVEMVGTLKAGIQLFGEEAAGTTIKSKGIIWELTFPKHRINLKEIDGRRAKISGELAARNGAQADQRLVLVVDEFTILPLYDMDVPKAAFKKITIEKSGGLIGANETLTIAPDGKSTRQNRKTRVTETFDLEAKVLYDLNQLVADTDWGGLPAKAKLPRSADMFQYKVTIQTDKTFVFDVDDFGLSQLTEVAKIIQLVK